MLRIEHAGDGGPSIVGLTLAVNLEGRVWATCVPSPHNPTPAPTDGSLFSSLSGNFGLSHVHINEIIAQLTWSWLSFQAHLDSAGDLRNHAKAHCDEDGLGAAPHPKLGYNATDMGSDGLFPNLQVAGNLFVGVSPGKQAQHFRLAPGKHLRLFRETGFAQQRGRGLGAEMDLPRNSSPDGT